MARKEDGESTGASRAVAALMRGFSLEATRPEASEIDALATIVVPGTRVYLSAVPHHPNLSLVEPAARLRTVGLDPVPHLAARSLASRDELDELLARFAAKAQVRCALVIAGDLARPKGPFQDALALIESGLLQRHGLSEIGLAAYPEGHPRIDREALRLALSAKLSAARYAGLAPYIVTQFGFETEPILHWIREARAAGITGPIRIGLAGPTNARALLRYALRCGVRASLKGLLYPKATQLMQEAAPDTLIGEIAGASDFDKLGPLALHFFSFGGLTHTARWARSLETGEAGFEAQMSRRG
jgi:methylenetetrahydrofolate reductase (NADPH)